MAAHGSFLATAWMFWGDDQQLAGVIMWVPVRIVYLAAALAILGGRLADLDRQAAPRPQEYS